MDATTTSSRTAFPCNMCSVTFDSNELQRSHMRQPWHIYNLRRRVAELPALTEPQYNADVQTKDPGSAAVASTSRVSKQPVASQSPSQAESQPADKIPSTQCLFCNLLSPSTDANVAHMSSVHSLFIPSPDQLSDLETFLGYLSTIIFTYHECLYCGLAKGSLDSVQTHMRDKGHCMITLDPESELLDFWDLSDVEDDDEDPSTDTHDGQGSSSSKPSTTATKISATEIRLPSGAVITPRFDTTQPRTRPPQHRAASKPTATEIDTKAITTSESKDQEGTPKPQPSSAAAAAGHDAERRIAVRGEMGLTGLSDAQKRALQLTEQKMKKREALAKAAQRHAMLQQPVKMKYYKMENPIYQAG